VKATEELWQEKAVRNFGSINKTPGRKTLPGFPERQKSEAIPLFLGWTYIPDLFYLVRFAVPGMRLQIEDFGDDITGKHVVAAFDAPLKARPFQKLHHAGKGDICVSAPS